FLPWFSLCSRLLATLAGLARFAADLLAAVANALAAVGLRRSEALDRGGELAELLLVRGVQDQHGALGVPRDRRRHAGRHRDARRMGQAQVEVDDCTLELAAVTGAVQLEDALVAFRGALDHARDQR